MSTTDPAAFDRTAMALDTMAQNARHEYGRALDECERLIRQLAGARDKRTQDVHALTELARYAAEGLRHGAVINQITTVQDIHKGN